MIPITETQGKYEGAVAWVIGRGPSLARLSQAHIGPGPVVAVNQAIERVESLELPNDLYALQKDHFFGNPSRAALILHEPESVRRADPKAITTETVYRFDAARDFGLAPITPSVAVAVDIAKLWGCRCVVMLCCDAAVTGDLTAYGMPATQPADYLQHPAIVRARSKALEIPVEWRRV